MPSESHRRRRSRRHRGPHRGGAGKQEASASMNFPPLEEDHGDASTSAEANASIATSSNPKRHSAKTPEAKAPSYAQRVKLGTSSNWRNLGSGPSSRTTSRYLFAEKEKKAPSKTLLDFKSGLASNKTTLYIPPPLRNRNNSESMSFLQTSQVTRVEDVTTNEPDGAAALAPPDDFLDPELNKIFNGSINKLDNYEWLFDPLTNYLGDDNWDPFKPDPTPLSAFGTMTSTSPPVDGAGTSSPGPLASQIDFLKFGWKLRTEEVPESGQAQKKDEDGNFNWGDLMMTPPMVKEEMTGNPTPGMYVYPVKVVNFANVHIQFGITAFNIPQNFKLTSKLFEAVAESPSGVSLPCLVKSDPDKTRPSWSPRMVEYFQGNFKANEEIGLYKVQVRLSLPMTRCYQRFGVVGDESSILVSRNYFRESQKEPCALYSMNFDPTKLVAPCGTGNSAMTARSWGLACDKTTNRLYYTERLGNRVTCMDPEVGQTLFHFDESRHTLNRPTGIACDEAHRRVFVCDKDNHKICYYSMDGLFLGSFGTQGFQNGMFCYPWDVDVSPMGTHIAVTDSRNKRLQLFDHYGNYIDKFSVFEKNPFIYKDYFDYPRGVAFGHDGQLIYTTDFNSQNILEIPLSMARFQRLVPEGHLRRPQGIVVDEIGCILVADTRNNCVRHLAFDGTHLSTIRNIGGAALKYPVNLTLMQSGHVAVMDLYGRISCF